MDNYNSPFDDMTESEHVVADFMAKNGMWWQYEQPVFVRDDKGRPRVWTPDFFIPRLGLYVEVIGNNEATYDFRREVYRLNNICIIFIYPNQTGWEDYLLNELIAIHKDRELLINRLYRM